ncbi:alpha/beta hydrolase [Rugosimonospora acidiphila]|uniref:Alpha/beta hydrolase n=1 Tax=Rugosimonospora acidiphila TaxID=556531 RepID=A0ABP9SP86_9ACTN
MSEYELWEKPPGGTGTEEADRPAVTAFRVEAPRPLPAMLVVPGGGYSNNAEHEGAPVARWLNSLGVNAFVLRYRVAPYRYPVPLLDAQRAIRFIRHHADRFGVDPERVGVLGFSAGGHLAGMLATEPSNHVDAPGAAGDPADAPGPADLRDLDGVDLAALPADEVDEEDALPGIAVLCYPVASFVGPVHHGSLESLLGPQPSEAVRRRLSIELRIKPASPPTFLWHTADDQVVDVANARLVAEALRRAGVPHELHVYPHGRHGLGLAEGAPEASEWTGSCAAFLKTYGW